MLLGYGAKVGLGNMRVKAENRMVTPDFIYCQIILIKNNILSNIKYDFKYFLYQFGHLLIINISI